MVCDRFIALPAGKFHYREWSVRGTPLIFLHGLASQSHMFDLTAPRLTDTFRVLALDQRGHGESVKPKAGYDFATVTGDLLAFLDALRLERALLAGHSWGGNVALYFGAHYPERTLGLVLIDGGFLDLRANPEMTWARTARELAPPRLSGTPVDDFRQMVKQFAGPWWSRAAEAIILENFEIQPDQTIRPRLTRERHMQILRALWERRPLQDFVRVQCPVLVLAAALGRTHSGADLQRRRAQVAAAAQHLRDRRVVWFDATAHDIPLHRPRKLANVICRWAEDAHLAQNGH